MARKLAVLLFGLGEVKTTPVVGVESIEHGISDLDLGMPTKARTNSVSAGRL